MCVVAWYHWYSNIWWRNYFWNLPVSEAFASLVHQTRHAKLIFCVRRSIWACTLGISSTLGGTDLNWGRSHRLTVAKSSKILWGLLPTKNPRWQIHPPARGLQPARLSPTTLDTHVNFQNSESIMASTMVIPLASHQGAHAHKSADLPLSNLLALIFTHHRCLDHHYHHFTCSGTTSPIITSNNPFLWPWLLAQSTTPAANKTTMPRLPPLEGQVSVRGSRAIFTCIRVLGWKKVCKWCVWNIISYHISQLYFFYVISGDTGSAGLTFDAAAAPLFGNEDDVEFMDPVEVEAILNGHPRDDDSIQLQADLDSVDTDYKEEWV